MKEIEKLKKELEATRQSLGKVIQDVEKIKVFCAYVAEEHDHIPHLMQVWNSAPNQYLYLPNTTATSLDKLKANFMKTFLEIEDRLDSIENMMR